jgi:hypothetical protein
MPILHFSGNFNFQLPYFNNEPRNDARKPDSYDLQLNDENLKVKFDKNLTPTEVHERLLCDPIKYFEFEFSEVYVRRITYDDGSCTDRDGIYDPIVGERVMLRCLLVDVSPHLERGQFFAGEFRIVDAMIGKANRALQSKVYTNIRSKDVRGFFSAAAHFETTLYDIYSLEGPGISKANSRYLKEVKDLLGNLKIYLHLSRYDVSRNQGNAYGYISRAVPEANNDGVRLNARPLIVDSNLSTEVYNDFHLPDIIEGSYDILDIEHMLALRYLDFVPFVDRNYHSPVGYKYFVRLFDGQKEIDTKMNFEFSGYHNEMLQSGGVQIFLIPKEVTDLSNLTVKIRVKKNDWKSESSLMVEPKWDLALDDNHKAIKIGSRRQSPINARIYYNNQLATQPVKVYFESQENESSPVVAQFTKQEDTISSGNISAIIQAHNLEHSEEIVDPVTRDDPITKGKLYENLPWDRYYGNVVSIKIGDRIDPVAQSDIRVRVLHTVNPDDIPKNKISFKNHILPLFSYYLRYYPWLHVAVVRCQYRQFLDLNDASAIKEEISEITNRLERDDDDWHKMPRSRDFPIDGHILFARLEKEDMLI